MRRRWVPLLLALLAALALTACARSGAETEETETVILPVITAEETAEETPETAETPPEDPGIPDDAPETAEDPEAAGDPGEPEEPWLPEEGSYSSRDDVALYLHLYGHLPENYITKREAEALGWTGGSLEPYAPGKCIGGGRFGNYEGLLPDAPGRRYTECDIDTLGAKSRGAKRLVFSNDGLIYYTEDHYQTFELLYGDE